MDACGVAHKYQHGVRAGVDVPSRRCGCDQCAARVQDGCVGLYARCCSKCNKGTSSSNIAISIFCKIASAQKGKLA